MYIYDQVDRTLVEERVRQFRDQTQRYLDGKLSDKEFLPLRLQNGIYVQRHSPLLRVAVPYGMLSTRQLRKLAELSRKYDKSYVHVTTRQTFQLNWVNIPEVPDMLAELASVEMHAIQTSGSCVRNVTTDEYAGVAADELQDPRPVCEILRQWGTLNPEFAYLPRKFKIAVSGSKEDRAATQLHDVGVHLVENEAGEAGFRILVGGGLGRTPMIGSVIKEFLPRKHLLSYLEAILRVYNRYGRRDNKFKARIKILVSAMTLEAFSAKVDAEWAHLKDGPSTLPDAEFERMAGFFTRPPYAELEDSAAYRQLLEQDRGFRNWASRNVGAHKVPGYATVAITLKQTGRAPGDATDKQLDLIADLADQYSFGELRNTHQQNMVLADVRQDQLFELWHKLREAGLATPNLGLLTDIICCPGGDFCSVANAQSIPIAEAIQRKFDDLDFLFDLGELDLNISGCMNACGHHHIGHIGILGVDRKGEAYYQIQIGGSSYSDASLGKIIGKSFPMDQIPDVVGQLLEVYLEHRTEEERFIDTVRRIGMEPFKERVYGPAH